MPRPPPGVTPSFGTSAGRLNPLASSVSVTTGRSDKEKRSDRPCGATAARTRAMTSWTCSQVSPRNAWMSARLPARAIASSEKPSKRVGLSDGGYGFTTGWRARTS